MSEWLCESCRYRKGKLGVYHVTDTCGTEYSYTNVVRVRCAASRQFPVREAKRKDPFYEPWQVCMDYAKRKGK